MEIGRLKLRCPCGGDQFLQPEGLNLQTAEGKTVRCVACGNELKLPSLEEVTKAGQKAVADMLRQGLK